MTQEELNKKKTRAYDLLAMKDSINMELQQLNQEIAKEEQEEPKK